MLKNITNHFQKVFGNKPSFRYEYKNDPNLKLAGYVDIGCKNIRFIPSQELLFSDVSQANVDLTFYEVTLIFFRFLGKVGIN